MAQHPLDTLALHHFVERWQAGETEAANELLRAVGKRLEHITRKMLRGFPNVHAVTETGDVLQNSSVRLLNTLRRVQPESTRHFYNLAAVHVRRELLDLARHYRHADKLRPLAVDGSDGAGNANTAADQEREDHDLEVWCQFHEAVDKLPAAEREVIGLAFYHGWKQSQIAALLQVTERTVRRNWQSACLRLRELIGDKLPRP